MKAKIILENYPPYLKPKMFTRTSLIATERFGDKQILKINDSLI